MKEGDVEEREREHEKEEGLDIGKLMGQDNDILFDFLFCFWAWTWGKSICLGFFFSCSFLGQHIWGLDHGKMMMGTNYIVVPLFIQHMFVELIN